MRLIGKALLYSCPPHATTAYEYSYYTRPTGFDKIRLRFLDISDDIFDHGTISFSEDNGRTWSESRPHVVSRKIAEGTIRPFEGLGFIDPVKGLLVCLYLEGLFHRDVSLEGMTQYYLNYRVSADGGRTWLVDEQVVERGYTSEHPCEHVWVGRNCMSMPLIPPMVRTRQGHLVACIQISVLGPDGQYYNPGGGFTWLKELILIGRWQDDCSGRIQWSCGQRLSLPPEKSTRGLDECTLAEMPDGRLLLVMRASNGGSKDPEFRIPSYKWFSVSADGGLTWSEPQPWGFTDGEAFFSPASMSQILSHSNGRFYWIGNICPENAKGNSPRYPLVIGELDTGSLRLVRDSLFVIDTRLAREPEGIQFSNFAAHEDRADGTILLHVPKIVPVDGTWAGDSYLYRLAVR